MQVYKTAEEIREEAMGAGVDGRGAQPAGVNIVDMRGKSAKLVRGADIAKEVSDSEDDAAFTLPLLHNITILIEQAESEIFRLQKASETQSDAKVVRDKERREAVERVDAVEYNLGRLEEVMAIVDRTHRLPCFYGIHEPVSHVDDSS